MRRELLRDVTILAAITLVLGTAANLPAGRHLAWWGKGQLPPREGTDFQWLDPASADSLRSALPHVVFLDTRSSAEYRAGHVPGAVPLSYTDLERDLTPALLKSLRQADAVILCGASEEADVEQLLAQELHRRGLSPPHILLGAFAAWVASGLPVDGVGS